MSNVMTLVPQDLPALKQDIENIGKISIVPSLLNIICRTTGMGFAAVARLTDSQWIACSVRDEILFGLEPGGELKLETTICNEIRQHTQAVVIDDISKNPAYAQHHSPKMYGYQSYISVPIFRKDGRFFGTLCAIDPKPHKVENKETIDMFNLYADLISYHLQSIETVSFVEEKLAGEKKMSEIREQFIAILGHDLKNPLNAIIMAASMIRENPIDVESMQIIDIIERSATRMTGLINHITDFASARMGDGIHLNKDHTANLEQSLEQVINEHRVNHPGRKIHFFNHLSTPVYCDESRIAELFSNILSNAIAYGEPGSPVAVVSKSEDGFFILSVSNKGEIISGEAVTDIFQPFTRGKVKKEQKGLGLGLYIASEIARAHNGSMQVISENGETIFTLRIPIQSASLPVC